MPMLTRKFTLQFSSPAFLGDAGQNGAWRTPPIKALLRQWWRVAYAAGQGFRADCEQDMRHAEGLLFGHAWLEDDQDERDERGKKVAARQSLVRLRLDRWDEGRQRSWQALGSVLHPEKGNIDAGVYLGYGPIRNPTQLKKNAAIQAGESAILRLAYPDEHAKLLEHALWLMDRYGTLGGRSRNGWGSFFLKPEGEGNTQISGNLPLRDWQASLDRDWPHAIGKNEQGALIWQTAPQTDWKAVMKELARIKIGLRTHFIFPNVQPPHHNVLPRHWLSYPITRHTTQAFPGDARLPNSLRFKLRPAQNGQVAGVIFHVPCLPPNGFRPQRNEIESVWQQAHEFLDQQQSSLTRIPE